MYRPFLFTILLVLAFIPANAQDEKGGDETIRVETQLVDVPVAVMDARGVPMRGLKATNFKVFEDGKPQEVAEFSTAAEPFEVALILDTSGSTRADLQLIQRAAFEFVNFLRPGDRVAVIGYATDRTGSAAVAESRVLSPLTGDRRALRTAIDTSQMSNGTPFYDSLVQAAEEVFRDKPSDKNHGRRAIVALTDGVDSTSGAAFATARDALGDAGIVAFFVKVDTRDYFEESLLGDCKTATRFSAAQIRRYYKAIGAKSNTERAVNFCQLGDFERLAISKKLYEIADGEMDELARVSGGKVFPVGELSEARSAFKEVAEEIGTKYTIAYYPSNEKRDGTYRKITVQLTAVPKGATVRAREGYTAPTR